MTAPQSSQPVPGAPLPDGWLGARPWIIFLLPMIVYMLASTWEPTPPDPSARISTSESAESQEPVSITLEPNEPESIEWDLHVGLFPRIPYRFYPQIYTIKIVLTVAAMVLVLPGYCAFRGWISPLAPAVGVVGVVLWVVICQLQLEARALEPIGLGWVVGAGQRSAFNPLEQLADNPAWAYGFLAIRLFGLAVVVPVIEEFFLRGFVMRIVMQDQWWKVPFGAVNQNAVIAGTAVPMLMHPGELLAALVWFSMVTWLMVKTRNIWDCVVAHAVTNLLLGLYVIASGEWQLM